MLKIIIISLLILCSCTSCQYIDVEKTTETTETTQKTVTMPVNSDDLQPYPLFINDVEIDCPPQRVVVLSPSLFEIVVEQGYKDTIIGKNKYCIDDTIPNVDDVGSIIALNPSVVLSSTAVASKDIFELEQAQIKVIIMKPPSTIVQLSEIYGTIGLLYEGMFTGKEKGEQYVADLVNLCVNDEQLNIGNFLYITEDFNIATSESLESNVFSCFGTNVANGKDYNCDMSKLEKAPDIILLNNKYKAEDLQNVENISTLNAVKNGKIILVDNSIFEVPTSKMQLELRNVLENCKKIF